MAKMKKVVKVELRETVTEAVRKHKRHDYARGGYKIEEVIHRVTSVTPFAMLECGHWRQEHNHGTQVSKATRLECYECDLEERMRARKETESLNAKVTGSPALSASPCGLTGYAAGENGEQK